jgi:DNA topoisomerase-3
LALYQNEEGRWRVEFDEPWAREGEKQPAVDEGEAAALAVAQAKPADAA